VFEQYNEEGQIYFDFYDPAGGSAVRTISEEELADRFIECVIVGAPKNNNEARQSDEA
jgi:hypothetical protein